MATSSCTWVMSRISFPPLGASTFSQKITESEESLQPVACKQMRDNGERPKHVGDASGVVGAAEGWKQAKSAANPGFSGRMKSWEPQEQADSAPDARFDGTYDPDSGWGRQERDGICLEQPYKDFAEILSQFNDQKAKGGSRSNEKEGKIAGSESVRRCWQTRTSNHGFDSDTQRLRICSHPSSSSAPTTSAFVATFSTWAPPPPLVTVPTQAPVSAPAATPSAPVLHDDGGESPTSSSSLSTPDLPSLPENEQRPG
ncbi:hypothetical protein R3P38DRAFT_2759642 [Favolaschia claudopus]|uniref:Uncharacterized protein n=1 Tax=Favolaschia claudopus TaxID=2862362 RepID=A0AAW0E1K2_9AGAR